jgi:hypothetical protein
MNRLSIFKFAAPLVAAVLTFAVAAPAAHAQASGSRVSVNVPFGFQAGSRHFEPGTYRISMVNQQTILISGSSKSAMTFASWTPDSNRGRASKVVFHRYGDQYFMREIWTSGQSGHLASIESKAEATARTSNQFNIASNRATMAADEVALIASPQ